MMVMQSMFVVISTHTLTWSVTVVTADFAVFATYFNSHAHVERDWRCILLWCAL